MTGTRPKTARGKVSARRTRRPKTAMRARAKALSLHIGLNAVDPRQYEGWGGPLVACENDANDMAAIARARDMTPTVLLTRHATRKGVLAAIRKAAQQLKAGDLFFLSYSGHGGQVKDITGDEPDKKDETWCLFDGELIDDELYVELGQFAKGVRILVLSDSCHSGSVTRARIVEAVDSSGRPGRSKALPPDVAERTYEAHKRFYDGIQQQVAEVARRKKIVDPDEALAHVASSPRSTSIVASFKPACILMSGCQDNQTSLDGDHNGAFTEQLLTVWHNGAFTGNYARFHALIKSGMPPSQTPNLFVLGSAKSFLAQHAFQL